MNNDLIAQLEQFKADNASALAQLAEALASKAAFEALVADRDNDVAAARKAVSEANALVAEKDIELANLRAAIEGLKATQKTAEQQAVEIVAEQGIKPLKVEQTAQAPASKAEIVAKLESIKDPVARGEFYAANRAALFDK